MRLWKLCVLHQLGSPCVSLLCGCCAVDLFELVGGKTAACCCWKWGWWEQWGRTVHSRFALKRKQRSSAEVQIPFTSGSFYITAIWFKVAIKKHLKSWYCTSVLYCTWPVLAKCVDPSVCIYLKWPTAFVPQHSDFLIAVIWSAMAPLAAIYKTQEVVCVSLCVGVCGEETRGEKRECGGGAERRRTC